MAGPKNAQEKFAADYVAKAALNPAVLNGVAAMLSAQSELLASFEDVMSGWISRRREALEEAQSSLKRMSGCKDLDDVWRVQQDWMSSEMRRLSADAGAFSNAMALFSRTVGQEMEGARRTFGEASRRLDQQVQHAGEELLRAAGGKPGTAPRAAAAQG